MERSKELAEKAFNVIIKGIDDEPMDGDETTALANELMLLLDDHFANV